MSQLEQVVEQAAVLSAAGTVAPERQDPLPPGVEGQGHAGTLCAGRTQRAPAVSVERPEIREGRVGLAAVRRRAAAGDEHPAARRVVDDRMMSAGGRDRGAVDSRSTPPHRTRAEARVKRVVMVRDGTVSQVRNQARRDERRRPVASRRTCLVRLVLRSNRRLNLAGFLGEIEPGERRRIAFPRPAVGDHNPSLHSAAADDDTVLSAATGHARGSRPVVVTASCGVHGVCPAGATARAAAGSAGADERVDRRADPEGLAQRGADPGEQLWPAERGSARRRRHGRRDAAVHRLRVRDRPGWLHPDQRARGERRAADPDCAARGQRGWHARDRVVRQGTARHRTDRGRHHRTGPGGAEG